MPKIHLRAPDANLRYPNLRPVTQICYDEGGRRKFVSTGRNLVPGLPRARKIHKSKKARKEDHFGHKGQLPLLCADKRQLT